MGSTMTFYSTASAATISSILAREDDLGLSRSTVTVRGGVGAERKLKLGTVLGKTLFAAPVIAAEAGNTGDGALGTLTLGDACKQGVYTVTCIAAAADGGRFQVVDPDGYRMADAEVGVAFAGPQLGFTIADGAADFVVGDAFTVTIAAGDGKVVALDPDATDGTQLAYGVLAAAVTAPDGVDVPGDAITSDAVLVEPGLIWPDGYTEDQKTAAKVRMAHDGNRFITAA